MSACCCCLPLVAWPQADAEQLESQARSLSGPDGLVPDASGNELQQALAAVAASTESGKFAYNRFFAVGLFRWGSMLLLLCMAAAAAACYLSVFPCTGSFQWRWGDLNDALPYVTG
jgi:hypothetical protein